MKHGRPIWLAALESGIHGCFFYTTPNELLEIAIPILKEGLLQTRERCLWILPPKISFREAKEALAQATKLDISLLTQQHKLVLIPRDFWYPDPKIPFDIDAIIKRGKLLMNETVQFGFEGLRIVGHALSSKSPHWEHFLELEERLGKKLNRKPITSIAAYSLRETPMEVLDIITSIHAFSLVRHSNNWHLLPGSHPHTLYPQHA